MKVSTKEFKKALQLFTKVVDSKNSRNLLNCIQLEFKDGTLKISGTDLETSASYEMAAILGNENFLINLKVLQATLKDTKAETLEFSRVTENDLRINDRMILDYKNEAFTILPESPKSKYTMESKKLLGHISAVKSCVSKDETRIFLNSIYFEKLENQNNLVATNGYIMAVSPIELPLKESFLLPRESIAAVEYLLKNSENIKFSTDSERSYFETDKIKISSRSIVRDYLKYSAVIPKKTSKNLEIELSPLVNALKGIIAGHTNKRVFSTRIKLTENLMELTAITPELTENIIKIKCDYFNPDIEFGFNAKLLLESLESIAGSSHALIGFNNELSPFEIKSDKTRNFSIAMPLKI